MLSGRIGKDVYQVGKDLYSIQVHQLYTKNTSGHQTWRAGKSTIYLGMSISW